VVSKTGGMDRKKTVLIVDDQMDMRIYMSTLFETSGYAPVTVANGKAGFRKAREIQPDLIILDVMMPGEGGVTMYRELRQDPALKTVPVIMLSAVAETSFDHYLNMLNAQLAEPIPRPDHYMEKPPRADLLLTIARRILTS
jgi:CheY-like chemotaxis protein